MVLAQVVRQAVGGSVVLLALASCETVAPSASAPEFFFPRHAGTLGTGDAALVEGIAVMEDGCLLLQTADGTRYLPLWPQDMHLGKINDLPAVLGPNRDLLAEVGDINPTDRVELGGSEVPRARATELVGAIPERCAVGRYWVVGDVLTQP